MFLSHSTEHIYVLCSTKCSERTWQSLTCHIENPFEQQKTFSFQIKARLNQRKIILKMNSLQCIYQEETDEDQKKPKNHELSRKLGGKITHGCTMKRRQWSATSIFVGNLRIHLTPLQQKLNFSCLYHFSCTCIARVR